MFYCNSYLFWEKKKHLGAQESNLASFVPFHVITFNNVRNCLQVLAMKACGREQWFNTQKRRRKKKVKRKLFSLVKWEADMTQKCLDMIKGHFNKFWRRQYNGLVNIYAHLLGTVYVKIQSSFLSILWVS